MTEKQEQLTPQKWLLANIQKLVDTATDNRDLYIENMKTLAKDLMSTEEYKEFLKAAKAIQSGLERYTPASLESIVHVGWSKPEAEEKPNMQLIQELRKELPKWKIRITADECGWQVTASHQPSFVDTLTSGDQGLEIVMDTQSKSLSEAIAELRKKVAELDG